MATVLINLITCATATQEILTIFTKMKMTKTTTPVKEFRVCLSEQLEQFCKEQSLPNWCCDDLLHKDTSPLTAKVYGWSWIPEDEPIDNDDLCLSKDQREWLIDFQIAWCAVTDDEPM